MYIYLQGNIYSQSPTRNFQGNKYSWESLIPGKQALL